MLRIIAGTLKRRKLMTPPDSDVTRPMPDRIKTSLFDRLATLDVLGEGRVLDIFSGVGSLGIEALSRGAEHCTFIERDRRIRDLLEANLHTLGLRDRSTILSVDAIASAWALQMPAKSIRLIFLDPPYPMVRDDKTRPMLYNLLKHLEPCIEDGGLVMYRTPIEIEPEPVEGYLTPGTFEYGKMRLNLYPHDDPDWTEEEPDEDDDVADDEE